MQSNNYLKKKLRRGDQKYIAELTGYNDVYVRQVLSGKRQNKEIIAVTKRIIHDRSKLEDSISNRIRHKKTKNFFEKQTWGPTYTSLSQIKLIKKQAEQSENYEIIQLLQNIETYVMLVSHDIRTPVSNLQGLLVLLRKEMEARYPELMNISIMIDLNIQHIYRMLDDFFDTAKKDPAKQEKTNLYAVLEEVKRGINQLIKQSEVQIKADFSACFELPYSAFKLKGILHNLLTNAIKYRSRQRIARIELKTQKVDQYICLSVKDNGIGIDARSERIGEIRGMRKEYRSIEGHGVGLYIIKRLVEADGGKITVSSKLDRGSIFRIYLKHVMIHPH